MERRNRLRLLRVLAAITLNIGATSGQTTAARPTYKLIRYEEDWAALRDSPRRSFKYIPLAAGSRSHLTLGGEMRQRYEYFRNPVWGLDPSDGNGYLLQRYMLHADLHLGHSVRFFGQLKSGIETGRTGGRVRPTRTCSMSIRRSWRLRSGVPGADTRSA